MFEVNNLIYNIFKLILASLTDFSLAQINKFLEFSKVISKEDLEFFSRDWYQSSTTNLLLILLLVV